MIERVAKQKEKILNDLLWVFTVLAGLSINELLKNYFKAHVYLNDYHVAIVVAYIAMLANFHISNMVYHRLQSNTRDLFSLSSSVDLLAHFIEYFLFFWYAEAFTSDAYSSNYFTNPMWFLWGIYLVDTIWSIIRRFYFKSPEQSIANDWIFKNSVCVILVFAFQIMSVSTPNAGAIPEIVRPWFAFICKGAVIGVILFFSVLDLSTGINKFLDTQNRNHE